MRDDKRNYVVVGAFVLAMVVALVTWLAALATCLAAKPAAKQAGLLPRADEPDFAAVRMAIRDLIDTFGPRYPSGREYLARLDALEVASTSNDRSAPAELRALREEALLANRMPAKETGMFTVCGRYCESGDILIEDISVPAPKAGDILVVAGSGAYCVPMQSNYNAALHPAIVFVKDGSARLVRRRETLEDLTRCELV